MIVIQDKEKWIDSRRLLIFLTILCIFFICTCTQPSRSSSKPKIIDGYLDLVSWGEKKLTPMYLNGKWEFYWKKFLEYKDFQNNEDTGQPGLITVPGLWKYWKDDNTILSHNGFCTYRLHINLPGKLLFLGLRMKSVYSSYKLYINNKLIIENGKTGKTKETYKQSLVPQTVFFETEGPVDLILQVSNFKMEDGGIIDPILLGGQNNILHDREINLGWELFLIGSALIIGLYHIIFALGKKKENAFLFFGLFSIVLAMRIALHSEQFFVLFFPDLSSQLIIRFQFLTYYFAVPLFVQYLYYLFPDENWKYFPLSVLILYTAAVITLFFPYRIMNTILSYMNIPTLFTCLYIYYIIVKAFIHKREGTIVFFIGYLIFSVTVINDIFYTQEILLTRHFFSFGIFLFIFCQAILLNFRFSVAFENIKKLLENLNLLLEVRKKYSEELENEVSLRTSDLSEASRALVRAMENVNRANQAKSIFLANMSHELRTPLNAILGFAEIIEKQGEKDNFHKYSRMIVKESEKLLALINQILDISKIEAGKLEIESIPFVLTDLINSVSGFYGLLAKESGLTFEMKKEGNIPEYVKGDPLRLRQILVNLIGNAVKFTHEGGITVIIENIEKKQDNKVFLKFKIIDTGIGIPKNKHDVIFQKFEQGENYVTKKYGGSGLGITLAKQFVELLGGEIGIESTVGKGSIFWFVLPFELSSETEKEELKIGSVHFLPSQIYATILVVEDYPANQQVVTFHLSHTGCNVLIADNGKTAIDMLGEHTCDLILMDIQMPIMDGYEATEYIRNKLKMKEIPIIGLTAHAFEYERKHCIDAGMNDVLVKPFQKKQLIERITYWLLHYSHFDKKNIVYDKPDRKKKLSVDTFADSILSPINLKQVENEFAGDMVFFHRILFTFLSNLDEQIPLLGNAIINKEWKKIIFEAHRIKGGASNIRAEKLFILASELEQMGKSEIWADLNSKFSEFKKEVSVIWKFYNKSKKKD